MRLPDPCLVVLIGVSGSGKSTWAAAQFGAARVVSSDALRAVVGLHEHDQRASKDAFDVLERIVDARLRRGFTTVIDSLGIDAKRRARWIAIARKRGVPVHAMVLGADPAVARSRNRARDRPVPSAVLSSQLAALPAAIAGVAGEDFDGVHHIFADTRHIFADTRHIFADTRHIFADTRHIAVDTSVDLVPPRFLTAPDAARSQQEDPVPLTFALHLGRFAWPGGGAELATNLRRVGTAAEEAGFVAISAMDHMLQIPGVGPEWEDLPDSTTALGFLAAATSRVRLGALVHGITYRNLAQLGKQVATLDVLSGGRAFCGLGAAWHGREHDLFGWDFPPPSRRYELLEDALELFPLLWGPGSPAFEGRTVTVPEAICYPRPVQERIPILVGGSGERRTLRLVARHADVCNLFGEPEAIRHKVGVLRRHCKAEDRDPATITVTQLSEAAVMAPGGHRYTAAVGTVEEQVGRFRALADAGVQQVFVALHEDGTTEQIERFAEVIAAFG